MWKKLKEAEPISKSLLWRLFPFLFLSAIINCFPNSKSKGLSKYWITQIFLYKQSEMTPSLYGGKSMSVWLWETTNILNTNDSINDSVILNVNQLIQFCEQKQITSIYLQINRDIPFVQYRYLVNRLSQQILYKNGSPYTISVQALDGAPNWVVLEGETRKNAFWQWVINYQNSSNEKEKFSGIHLDVEPHTGALWQNNEADGVLAYQNFINDFKSRINESNNDYSLNMDLAVDIPFWYDSIEYNNIYGQGNLAEWVYEQIPMVTIMAYRDSVTELNEGVFGVAKKELMFGKKFNRQTIIGLETSEQIPNYISFFEEGEIKMLEVINGTVKVIDQDIDTKNSKYSFAIHDYENWKSLTK